MDTGVKIIAEPGRFYVASAYTLVVNIIAKKVILDEDIGSDGSILDLLKCPDLQKLDLFEIYLLNICLLYRGR